jgi:hypothetical protein
MSVATQQPVGAPVATPGSADKPNRLLGLLELPSVGALFLWMIVPLGLTIFYSFIRYSLLNPDISGFAGLENYQYLIEDEAFWPSIINTVILVGSVLIITIVFGTLLAVLYDRDFFGKNVATLLVIAPFFGLRFLRQRLTICRKSDAHSGLSAPCSKPPSSSSFVGSTCSIRDQAVQNPSRS